MTINLAGVGDGWFEGRREALVRGWREIDPDVVLLQEVASRGSPYPYDQVADLSDRVKLAFACFSPYGNPAEVVSRERGGIALLSRWPFRWVESLQLPEGANRPDARVAILAILQAPHGLLRVVNAHLSWPLDQAAIRLTQVAHARDRLQDLGWQQAGIPLVLGGDLNADEREPAIALLSELYCDVFRKLCPEAAGYTWSHANPLVWHPNPDRRLDYLFADRSGQILEAGLTFDDPAAPASDHYGVWARLRWASASKADIMTP